MGSGGGGSTSGKVDFPEYMKTFHGQMLNHGGVDSLVVSVTDAFNYAAGGNSPYYAYITDSEPIAQAFMGSGKTINSYAKVFEMLESFQGSDFDTLYNGYKSNTTPEELLSSVSTALDDEIVMTILPKFRANLRSIGAVNSSAFAIGEALIWDSKLKAIAKERLTIEQIANQNKEIALKLTLSAVDLKKQIVLSSVDVIKVYYALKTDLADHYAGMNAKDLKWDIELYQYVNNTLASISGSGLSQGDKGASKVGSALTGALSGAAMGAMVGSVVPGLGTALGAGIGGVMGLAGGLFS